MSYPVGPIRTAFSLPPRPSDADAEVAIMAAVIDAEADGVVIPPDEMALIRRRQRGEISREVFLGRLGELNMAAIRAMSAGGC